MRILHVIPTIDPNAGGPPLICARLAIAQARLGHDVSILAHRPPLAGRARIAAENGPTAGFDRVTLHELPPITWPERVFGLQARRALERLVPAVDAVHLHGVWEPMLRHAGRAARRSRRPYLVLLNGMLMPWAMRSGTWKKRAALLLGHRRMLARGVPQFGSADEAAAFGALGFANPGVTIPNGAFPEDYADLPPAGTFRAAHPALGDAPYILFLGRLSPQKGIDLLLAAFAEVARRHPAVRLVIAGPAYGADVMAGDRRVLRVGPVYGRAKLAALRDAACFCLPSRHEGFSLAVVEAMACGVPVVVSTECHFPEVESAGAGLVVPLATGPLADALLRALADDRLRGVGRRMVAERYNWMTIAAETIHAYQSEQ